MLGNSIRRICRHAHDMHLAVSIFNIYIVITGTINVSKLHIHNI